jgi:hypothetical protein
MANVEVIQTKDMSLTFSIDFANKNIGGSNTLTMVAIQDTSEVILDFKQMDII